MDKIEMILKHRIVADDKIPSIPLYIDQVTMYIDEIFNELKINEEEKILTKTMINNYVKAGLIKSPLKKKYTKEQIMKLIMIYKFKNVISINDIKDVLNFDEDVPRVYKLFLETEKEVIKKVEELKNKDDLDTIFKLLISANLQKKMAEILISNLKEQL